MSLNPLLPLASLIYRGGLFADRLVRCARATQLPVPVLSIGNLTVGGTGKTPFLFYLTQSLIDHQLNPAVLSRGYQGPTSPQSKQKVMGGDFGSNPQGVSDEALLFNKKFPRVPLAVGSDRLASAQLLFQQSQPDIILLDDGFQHWPIKRKVDVVCIDVTNPWGGGHLLPWGRLREPLSSLKRAHWIILTRTELGNENSITKIKEKIHSINPELRIIRSAFDFCLKDHKDRYASDILIGKNVLAVSGIGNPDAFEKNLLKIGVQSLIPMRFSDHCRYRLNHWELIQNMSKEKNAVIVGTEKDWVKWEKMGWTQKNQGHVYYLEMGLSLHPEDQEQMERLIQDLK